MTPDPTPGQEIYLDRRKQGGNAPLQIFMKRTKIQKTPKVFSSLRQASSVLGISVRLLRELKARGADGFHGSRVRSGELLAWMKRHKVKRTAMTPRDALEIRKLLAQCERIEFAGAVDRGERVDRNIIADRLAQMGHECRWLLKTKRHLVPMLLEGRTTAERADLIDREISQPIEEIFNAKFGEFIEPQLTPPLD